MQLEREATVAGADDGDGAARTKIEPVIVVERDAGGVSRDLDGGVHGLGGRAERAGAAPVGFKLKGIRIGAVLRCDGQRDRAKQR